LVVLALGAAGEPLSEAGEWLYRWLLERGCWPEGSFLRHSLQAGGRELRFVAAMLDRNYQESVSRRAFDSIAWIGLQTGETVAQPTPGAFRDLFLLHVTDQQARQDFERIGQLLWQRIFERQREAPLLDAGIAWDIGILADYFSNLARLTAEHPLPPEDQHLAGLPAELAFEVGHLAAQIEYLKRFKR
jgi:hypothetical protein